MNEKMNIETTKYHFVSTKKKRNKVTKFVEIIPKVGSINLKWDF